MTDIGKSELDRARWNGTDSTFEGFIVARYKKLNGKPMVVLEDERGLNHIYPVSDRLEVARSDLASASEGREPWLDMGKVREALKEAKKSIGGHSGLTRTMLLTRMDMARAQIDAALLALTPTETDHDRT